MSRAQARPPAEIGAAAHLPALPSPLPGTSLIDRARRAWRQLRRSARETIWRRRERQAILARLSVAVNRAAQRSHGLPAPLIVSLTSYPPRFPVLAHTLRSLLHQSVAPDRLILWVAHEDRAQLPESVTKLLGEGVEVRTTENSRSFKKIVPALTTFPDAIIVTADDDLYYPAEWLAAFVDAYDDARRDILYLRGHRMRCAASGEPMPYAQWQHDIDDTAARAGTTDIVPTGAGGVLYPPGALHPDTVRSELFAALAPTADDLWLYWMARRTGARHRKVGPGFRQLLWDPKQPASLSRVNQLGANDRQVAALVARFGLPVHD